MLIIAVIVFITLITIAAVTWFTIVTCNSPFEYKTKGITDFVHFDSKKKVQVDFGTTTSGHAVRPLTVKQSVNERMIALFTHLVQHLNEAQLQFWLVDQTLLSHQLFGGLAPYQSTLDIAILHEDLEALVALRKTLEKGDKFQLLATTHYYLLSERNNFARYPAVRITLMTKSKQEVLCCSPLDELGRCSLADSHTRRASVFRLEHVFPLTKATFQGLEVQIPGDTAACLSSQYLSDYTKRVVLQGNSHFYNGYADALKARLLE